MQSERAGKHLPGAVRQRTAGVRTVHPERFAGILRIRVEKCLLCRILQGRGYASPVLQEEGGKGADGMEDG